MPAYFGMFAQLDRLPLIKSIMAIGAGIAGHSRLCLWQIPYCFDIFSTSTAEFRVY